MDENPWLNSLSSDAIEELCLTNEICSLKLKNISNKKNWKSANKKKLFAKLVDLIADEETCLHVASRLHCLILPLLCSARKNVFNNYEHEDKLYEAHQLFSIALSKLMPLSIECRSFAAEYLRKMCPFFIIKSSCTKAKKQKLDDAHSINDGKIAKAARMFVEYLSDSIDFVKLWDWSDFSHLLESNEPQTLWDAQHCVARLHGMSSRSIKKMRLSYFKETVIGEMLISDEMQLQGAVMRSPVSINSNSVHFDLQKYYPDDVAVVCGVCLPKITQNSQQQNLSTERRLNPAKLASTKDYLRRLATAVKGGRSVLIEGPLGCGKTTLVETLAAMVGRTTAPHFIKIQLGDQTDSKALLGTYRCSEVPGEFTWQIGVLAAAVRDGHWVLLEDLDCAPMDVITMLTPLLEGRGFQGQHNDVINTSADFRLFATRRLHGKSNFRSTAGGVDIAERLWSIISLESLPVAELRQVIVGNHPQLETMVDRFVSIYTSLCTGGHSGQTDYCKDDLRRLLIREGRFISTRDLMKWCSRIAEDIGVGEDASTAAKATLVYQDALDTFASNVSNKTLRLALAEEIAVQLNLNKSTAEYYCYNYKPIVETSASAFRVGRSTLLKCPLKSVLFSGQQVASFAYTRQSMALLEQVAVCVHRREPILLVGETGCGKTATVQYLSQQIGKKLRVINLNQQSDSADLLGGFKPIDVRFLITPFKEKFEALFSNSFSRSQNIQFLKNVQKIYNVCDWNMLLEMMQHVQRTSFMKFAEQKGREDLAAQWKAIDGRLRQLKIQLSKVENALAFSFVEGTLVNAVRNGDWVLLDEINLASTETLECLSGLLESEEGSIVLVERGDTTPIVRHPDFRLFACMNPATDVGKKDLPSGIRNRFTEFYVGELEDVADLCILVREYLKALSPSEALVDGIVKFYLTMRQQKTLTDGTGHKPYYSLRTFCRALKHSSRNKYENVQRSIYEGFCLSFLTQLDRSSYPLVEVLIQNNILGKKSVKSILKRKLPAPKDDFKFVLMEGYWIAKGKEKCVIDESYVLTESVKLNLRDLSRVVSAGKQPVLLQGETSVGKTSLITWLAKATGNQCVRINNHEHTDIQEYIGCYSATDSGKLKFQEGALVQAMRKGSWIILDELNLAPSDVLEALNRLLDDNRELYIPETQQTVKAHKHFMLFATQNPPGMYAGRKVLSRAFRNRFVELHFDEIPSAELQIILHHRCCLPKSHCKKLVAIMLELQVRRRHSGVFQGKKGFITLRDLFRWAERYRLSSYDYDINKVEEKVKFFDWDQLLADNGYMLLAGRVRHTDENSTIVEVIRKHLKRTVDPEHLYDLPADNLPLETLAPGLRLLKKVMKEHSNPSTTRNRFKHIVWTRAMRRMLVLVGQALFYKEPVLLVGDTGCGKTTIIQLLSEIRDDSELLATVNCHLHSESSDFLGALRPVRSRTEPMQTDQDTVSGDDDCSEPNEKLFEWVDGPLVDSMRRGRTFLIDEISLADDSVLERLNSVLEPERTLLLAEKGASEDNKDVECIVAQEDFRLTATMNPGGDYGKKELSPALRNRFTEIWCPTSSDRQDLIDIANHNINVTFTPECKGHEGIKMGKSCIDFIQWLTGRSFTSKKICYSIRDLLSWTEFINATTGAVNLCSLNPELAYLHGATMIFLDAFNLDCGSPEVKQQILQEKAECYRFLRAQLRSDIYNQQHHGDCEIEITEGEFRLPPFSILTGPISLDKRSQTFAFDAPTTHSNGRRLLRACQLPNRAILLEGSPGVGKTSLVTAVAKAAGFHLTRINLSEQTDVTDLFGADMPEEGADGGHFKWRDGPLLKALKQGDWVVLDELNLASQSVLEALNACLDHRGEVFVSELSRTFKVASGKTRIFACQNPLTQGGGRKGLPKSFLNRFSQVYVDKLDRTDLLFILGKLYPLLTPFTIRIMVDFNEKIFLRTMVDKLWGREGSPWEFNLRDLTRWCDLMDQRCTEALGDCAYVVYGMRLRNKEDRDHFRHLLTSVVGCQVYWPNGQCVVTDRLLQFGRTTLKCLGGIDGTAVPPSRHQLLLTHDLCTLEALANCVNMRWMAILIGPQSSGKSSAVITLAALTGSTLKVLSVNSSMDTTDLLGGFEQSNGERQLESFVGDIESILRSQCRELVVKKSKTKFRRKYLSKLLFMFSDYFVEPSQDDKELFSNYQLMLNKISILQDLLIVMLCVASDLNIYDEDENELVALAKKLEDFYSQIKNEKSVNQGGRFQWQDSVLVQSLKQGYWLLIDNANFCSASVMDRLNALLEPQGELVLSERGVINGEIPSIKPHKNFRLFLSMDSKCGVISRAMRNRGIEIYVSGEHPSHSDDEVFTTSDLQSMVNSRCPFPDLCPAIVETYTSAKRLIGQSAINKSVRLDVRRLGQYTDFIVQMICMGSDEDNALKNSFVCVFINGIQEPQLLELLNEYIAGYELTSGLSRIRGHISPVSDWLATPTLCSARRSLGLVISANLRDPISVMLSVESTPSGHWKLSQLYAAEFIKDEKTKVYMYEVLAAVFNNPIMEKLKNMALGDDLNADCLRFNSGWDLRRNNYLNSIVDVTNMVPLINQIELIMRYSLRARMNEDEIDASGHALTDALSGLRLSELCHLGKVNRSRQNKTILYLSEFVKCFDSMVMSHLKIEHNLSDQHMEHFNNQAKWYERFVTSAALPYRKDDYFTSLALHWNWFVQEYDIEDSHENNSINPIYKYEMNGELRMLYTKLHESLGRDGSLERIYSTMRTTLGYVRSRLTPCFDVEAQYNKLADGLDVTVEGLYTNEIINYLLKSKSSSTICIVNAIQASDYNENDVRDLMTSLNRVGVYLEEPEDIAANYVPPVGPDEVTSDRRISVSMAALSEMLFLRRSFNIATVIVNKHEHALVSENVKSVVSDIVEFATSQCPLTAPKHILYWKKLCSENHIIEGVEGDSEMLSSCLLLALNNVNKSNHFHWLDNLAPADGSENAQLQESVSESFAASCATEVWGNEQLSNAHQAIVNNSSFSMLNCYDDLCANKINGNEIEDITIWSPGNVLLSSADEKLQQTKSLSEILWTIARNPSHCAEHFIKNSIKIIVNTMLNLYESILSTFDLSKECLDEFKKKILICRLQRKRNSVEMVTTLMNMTCDLVTKNAKLNLLQPERNFCELLRNASRAIQVLKVLISNDNSVDLQRIGLAWCYVGQLQALMLQPRGPVDPLVKLTIQLQHYNDEIKEIENEMDLRLKQVQQCMDTTELDEAYLAHPRIKYLLKKKSELEDLIRIQNTAIAYRPSPPLFDKLLHSTDEYMTSLGKTERLEELLTKLKSDDLTYTTLQEAQSYYQSVKSYVTKTKEVYELYYNDITSPYLCGILQILHGISILHDCYQKKNAMNLFNGANYGNKNISKGIERTIQLLGNFPYVMDRPNEKILDNDYMELILKAVEISLCRSKCKDALNQIYISRVMHCALAHIRLTSQLITSPTLKVLSGVCLLTEIQLLFGNYVARWKAAENKRLDQEAQKNSLFKYTSHGDSRTEDQIEADSIKEMFPNFKEDFEDITSGFTLEGKPSTDNQFPDLGTYLDRDLVSNAKVNCREQQEICDLHRHLFTTLTTCSWHRAHKNDDLSQVNILEPFISGYKVAAIVNKNFHYALGSKLDEAMVGGHCVAAALLVASSSDHESSLIKNDLSRPYDVYYDPNIKEVIQCRPFLKRLLTRCEELLSEWPDHPTIKQIKIVIMRIYSFRIDCSLMKYVAALEVLLAKCHEWQKNASRAVNLDTHVADITAMIVQWRKLELSCWRRCLDVVSYKFDKATSKWWFHLHILIKSYMEENQHHDEIYENSLRDHVNESLHKFLEECTLGEFNARLQMVEAFCCQMENYKWDQPRKEYIIETLWSVFTYYSQFKSSVDSQIKRLRDPIEKQLKGFVKVARWNDANFYALQNAVHKTHKTLHKHSKQFTNVLKQRVKLVLVDNVSDHRELAAEDRNGESENEAIDNSKGDVIDFHVDIGVESVLSDMKCFVGEMVQLLAQEHESDLQNRLHHLLSKAHKYTFAVVKSRCTVLAVFKILDETTAELIETVHALQALAVNKEKNEKRRKLEAKNIQLKKRKALSDLFKLLITMGLSYRKGLITAKSLESKLNMANVAPLNLEAIYTSEDLNKCDQTLLLAWDGCTKYHFRCISRRSLMICSLQSPAKDLGTANIDRCKGFSEYLMTSVNLLWSTISSHADELMYFRKYMNNISILLKCTSTHLPNNQLVHDLNAILSNLLEVVLLKLLELQMLIDCVSVRSDLTPLFDFLSEAKNKVQVLQRKLARVMIIEVVTRDIYIIHDEIMAEIKVIRDELNIQRSEMDDYSLCNPIVKATDSIIQHITIEIMKYSLAKPEHCLIYMQPEDYKKLSDIIDELITSVLLVIQDLNSNSTEDIKDERSRIQEFNLDLVLKKINKDFDYLRIKKVNEALMTLLASLFRISQQKPRKHEPHEMICGGPVRVSRILRSLKRVQPLLTCYAGISQCVLTAAVSAHRGTAKLLSTLFRLFAELAEKGFCPPDELSDEQQDGEGATEFDDIEGGGMGEGEGAKDVSDQIENEDQLDDTRKAGEENEEKEDKDKPDIENEENGIEMSEDMDGKVHDMDNADEEGEEGEEGDDENELDKEMGDLGDERESEKLDEQMWGSDEEEDKDEQKDDKKEEDGPGSGEKSESQMVAKDDNNDEGSKEADKDQKQGKEEDKDEEEIVHDLKEDPNTNEQGDEYNEEERDVEYKGPEQPQEGDEENPEQIPDDLDLDGDKDGEDEFMDTMDDQEDETAGEGDDMPKEEDESMPEDTREQGEDGKESNVEEIQAEDNNEDETEGKADEKPAFNHQELEEQGEEDQGADEGHDEVKDKKEDPDSTMDADPAEETPQCANEASSNANSNETKDKDSKGTAEANESNEGHMGDNSNNQMQKPAEERDEKKNNSQKKAGDTNEDRTLGSKDRPIESRMDAVDNKNSSRDKQQSEEDPPTSDQRSDLYEHVTEAQRNLAADENETQVVDAATEDQRKQMDGEVMKQEEDADEDVDVDMAPDAADEEIQDSNSREKLPQAAPKNDKPNASAESKEEGDQKMDIDDGPKIDTMSASRPAITSYETKLEHIIERNIDFDIEQVREELKNSLDFWTHPREADPSNSSLQQASIAWQQYEMLTLPLSRELCEQLRLILEPSQATKLKGDYKTGKRLNMRKVIPYIASRFRKDKIWLRRTKPSKRTYQVLIAMDDSKSMAMNNTRQLAFESLSVIANALTLLEAGQLGVCSFGETTNMIHPFEENFTSESGAKLLQQMSFEQEKTKIGHLLKQLSVVMTDARHKQCAGGSGNATDTAQLLLIVSDGRGLFLEGQQFVQNAARTITDANVFVVFVIIDPPENKILTSANPIIQNSVLDIGVPQFQTNGPPIIKPYMDMFPFPFYVILRETNSLPTILSDALRQWFELVNASGQ